MDRAGILLILLMLAPLLGQPWPGSSQISDSVVKVPAAIKQGPWNLQASSADDPYWYQTGAMGSSVSNNYVAASVMIRTAYDRVSSDAHSYWVGGFIANGAFVQVGFLNEVTTTNQPYCCAWFYEYFLSSNNGCCAPVPGPEGSAGPIGSWHNYTLASSGSGVWSFYLDGRKLGATPDLGGSSASDSGNNAPAAIAEVASASSNTDVIGPGEFRNLSFRTAGGGWQSVPSAKSFIWYGNGTPRNPPPNPYGAREVEGVTNDFLAGSNIPPLNTPAPASSSTPNLWPGPITSCCISFTFLDNDNLTLQPSWVSLQSSLGTPIFYTQYSNQRIEEGTWNLTMVQWHSVDVTLPSVGFTIPGKTSVIFPVNAFSIRLRVLGYLFGLPVSSATVTTTLPDSLSEAVKTDMSGLALVTQLPPSIYTLRISVPFGIPTILTENATGPAQVTGRVFGELEVLLIAGLPLSVAIVAVAVAVSGERKRRTRMPTIPPSMVMTWKCAACGEPLHAGQWYCVKCGAPVQPAPS